jgi:hypothetical protein
MSLAGTGVRGKPVGDVGRIGGVAGTCRRLDVGQPQLELSGIGTTGSTTIPSNDPPFRRSELVVYR